MSLMEGLKQDNRNTDCSWLIQLIKGGKKSKRQDLKGNILTPIALTVTE